MIKSMSEDEFLNKGVIFADNIKEALELYESVLLYGTKVQMEEFLWMAFQKNEGDASADFYYPVLSEEQKNAFTAGLSEEEKATLSILETEKKQVYYPLKRENLKFFAEITAREWLFSTFYFHRMEAMLWGNYGMKYPLFCKEKETLAKYVKIAELCGLEIGKCQ